MAVQRIIRLPHTTAIQTMDASTNSYDPCHTVAPRSLRCAQFGLTRGHSRPVIRSRHDASVSRCSCCHGHLQDQHLLPSPHTQPVVHGNFRVHCYAY